MKAQIPETFVPYTLLAPAADAAGRASAFHSLKGALKAWLVVHLDQGNAATVALTPNQASAVAGTGAKAISACRIWTKLDQASTSFVRQTDAASFTTDAALKVKVVIFEIDPTQCMDVANDFDCIRIATGASNAANITSAMLYIDPGYPGATQVNPLAD